MLLLFFLLTLVKTDLQRQIIQCSYFCLLKVMQGWCRLKTGSASDISVEVTSVAANTAWHLWTGNCREKKPILEVNGRGVSCWIKIKAWWHRLLKSLFIVSDCSLKTQFLQMRIIYSHRLFLEDTVFANESYSDGWHRGNFLKWKRAVVYIKKLTQATQPEKPINPVPHIVILGKSSQNRVFWW